MAVAREEAEGKANSFFPFITKVPLNDLFGQGHIFSKGPLVIEPWEPSFQEPGPLNVSESDQNQMRTQKSELSKMI